MNLVGYAPYDLRVQGDTLGRILKAARGAVFLLYAAALSCTSSSRQAGGDAVAVSDSAGVRILITQRLEWDSVRVLTGKPEFVLPTSESATALSLVLDAAMLDSDQLAVYDIQEQRLFLFATGGEPEDTLGGPGEGPGEFVAAASMTVVGKIVHVFDRSLRRITQFAPDGTVRRIVSLQPPRFPGNQHISFAWMIDNDRVLVWEYVENEQQAVSSSGDAERWVTPGRLRVVDLSTSSGETLLRAPARDWIVEGSRWWVAPFGPFTTLSFVDGMLYMSPGTHHVVNVVDPDSGLVASYRYPLADRPFDLDQLARLEDQARRDASEGGYPFLAEVLFSPDVQPPFQPAIQGLRATPWGEVWAHVHAPAQQDSSDWWVVGPDGRFRGKVRLPGRREILGFYGEQVILQSLDELDVPLIEIWELPEDLGGG